MLANTSITETDSIDINKPLNAHVSNTGSESEARILTQEEVGEHIRTYVAHLTKQLEKLTRLIQELLSVVHRQNLCPRVSTSANSSASDPSPDLITGGTGISPDNYNLGPIVIPFLIYFWDPKAQRYKAVGYSFLEYRQPLKRI